MSCWAIDALIEHTKDLFHDIKYNGHRDTLVKESIHMMLINEAKRQAQDEHYKVRRSSNTRRNFLDLLRIEIKKNTKSTTIPKRVLENQAVA